MRGNEGKILMVKIFRILVVLSTISYACFIIAPYIDYSFLTEKEIDVLSWDGYSAAYIFPEWLEWLSILVWIPLAIGMYLFNPIARKIYLVLTIVFFVDALFTGLVVKTSYEIALYQLTSFFDGAVLTMAYLTTSIGNKFENAP